MPLCPTHSGDRVWRHPGRQRQHALDVARVQDLSVDVVAVGVAAVDAGANPPFYGEIWIELLADACRSFEERCARGIEPDTVRIKANLENSLMLVTALNPHIGYEKSAKIALVAYREGTTLREAAVKSGFVTGEQFDEWVQPEEMV